MNRWFFWVLAPVMLGSAFILLVLLPTPPTLTGRVVLYVFSAMLVLGVVGLALPRRMGWALKAVALGVAFGYAWYVFTQFQGWRAGDPFMGTRRSDTNLFNALLGFLVFGLPALRFVLAGRSGSAVDKLVMPSEDDDPKAADVP